MPRGGGHFGGHHHGGGGGGGGHHHSHHHHHHHHRPYRSGVVFVGWWSGPGYYRRRSYIGLGICWVVFFLIIVAVILSTSLSTVDNNKDDSDDNEGFDTQYAPLETRLIDVSQTFCEGIELENPSHQMPATAYVLSKGPSLTDEHDYEISEMVTIGANSYQYWNYYLNHGSSMNASICVESGTSVEFYIIQGSKSFEHWQDREDSFIKFILVGSSCPAAVSVGLDFVDKTDDYFFAYASVDGTVTFETNMSFHRKEFGVVEQNIEQMCDAGGEYSKKCTVSVPYNDEYYFLLATGNTTSNDGDEDGASVSWSCQPRVWVYILAFLLPALFGIILITTICVICCICKRRRNSSYARLGDDAASAAAMTTGTTYVTTTTTAPAALSQPVKDVGPPYSTTTAPQNGYYGQMAYPPASQAGYSEQQPYPPTQTYPPMPQPAPYPPMTQNYGTVDNKP